MLQRTRNRRVNDPTFLEYLADQAKEQAAIKAEQDALAAAADAADPMKAFQKASDAEAEATLNIIRTAYIPESLLAVERLNGRVIANEQAAISNWKYFAANTPSFKPEYMGRPLLDAAERSQIIPTAPAYTKLHELMLAFSAYVEPEQAVAPPPVEEVETRTPSEIAEAKYKARMTEIVVYDPIDNKGYTEFDLENKVDAKTERRLRRLMEGKIGNNNYDTFIEIKDAQFRRDQDIAARAAAEADQR